MKIINKLILVIGMFAMLASELNSQTVDNYVPPEGYVPNASVAAKIGAIIIASIYGEDTIARESPFVATLRGETWVIQGTIPKGRKGGVSLVEISKRDGRIIRVIHGK